MKTLRSIIIWTALSVCGIGVAHAHSGESHVMDMKYVLNGFGDSTEFKQLAEAITKSIDSTMFEPEALVQGFPAKFREKIGPLPGNHRLLAHKWVVGEAIPKETLDMLEMTYPGRRGEIIELWREHSREVIGLTQKLTGLSPRKAKAMASLLYSIHLLGDVGPGNSMIDSVLPLEDIVKNIKRDLAGLGGPENPLLKSIIPQIDKVIRSGKQCRTTQIAKLISSGECATAVEAEQVITQRTAKQVMDVLHASEIGPAIKQGCPRLALDFSEKALRRVANRIPKLAGQGVAGEARLTSQAFGKGTSYAREVLKASGKQSAISAAEKTVVAAGLIAPNGNILVPALRTAGIEGGAVFLVDAGIASYQYIQGDITRPEMVREVEDAAIKGGTVGGAAAVAVILGASPAGWVVIGVGAGAYFITDIALGYYHEYQDGKYLNDEDLKAFGIDGPSPLDFQDLRSSLDIESK